MTIAPHVKASVFAAEGLNVAALRQNLVQQRRFAVNDEGKVRCIVQAVCDEEAGVLICVFGLRVRVND